MFHHSHRLSVRSICISAAKCGEICFVGKWTSAEFSSSLWWYAGSNLWTFSPTKDEGNDWNEISSVSLRMCWEFCSRPFSVSPVSECGDVKLSDRNVRDFFGSQSIEVKQSQDHRFFSPMSKDDGKNYHEFLMKFPLHWKVPIRWTFRNHWKILSSFEKVDRDIKIY